MRVFLAIAWLSNGVNGDFQEMGTGYCMDSQNIYYDSFTAAPGDLGYVGSLDECRQRSQAEAQSPGFAFSSSNDCTVYMNNGQSPSSFQVPAAGIVNSNYGNGEVKKASEHTTLTTCYKKLPATTSSTTRESTSVVSTATTSTTSTTTTLGVISGVTIDRYTVTTDAFCSNAIDSTDPSILRSFDSKESCWDFCSSQASCVACFRPCTDGTQGHCDGESCSFLAVSLCSTRVSDGCGAQI